MLYDHVIVIVICDIIIDPNLRFQNKKVKLNENKKGK